MSSSQLDTIRRLCPPLEPVPTSTEPILRPLPGMEAVLFDIYGTLLISACGDVGTATVERRGEAFRDALQASGLQLPGTEELSAGKGQPAAGDHFTEAIRLAHQRARDQGVEYPEVDIVEIWHDTIKRLGDANLLAGDPTQVDLTDLAVEYEVRVNPTWAMPGVVPCLDRLRQRGKQLGIISNAQFFTRELFPALLDQSIEGFGFEPDLQFYSYQWGQAKPGTFLYEKAADALSDRGVLARNVLYMGNDMLNDVAAAHRVGFRTALFAGDARSLRLRSDDARVDGIAPDLIVTHLSQLIDCIE